MNRRRGFSLIELLVAITVGSALAGIAVFLLYSLMKSHNTGREHMEYCQTVNRLAEQFRDDVHSMRKTSPDATGTSFDLLPNTADDTQVRYQCLDGRIDRSELQGEKIVRLESYMLPQDMMAAIKTEALGEATVAVIIITPKEQSEKIYRATPVRIEAVLGRDWRLFKALPKTSTEDQP